MTEEKDQAKEKKKVEETKEVEQKTEEKEKVKPVEKPAPSGKFKDLIKEIESLSVADLAELVKALEERFGVQAGAMAMPATGVGAAPSAGVPTVEEKSKFTVVLTSAGSNKIGAIKAVREIKPDLGLKDAKDFVEAAPKTVLEDVSKEEAETAKKKFEDAGATVELK